MANKAYKFRLYPTKEQEIMLVKTFGCVRFIYNKMLADKIEFYKETKQKLNNTPAQYKKEYEWLDVLSEKPIGFRQWVVHELIMSIRENILRDYKQ